MSPIYLRQRGLAIGWFSNESGEPPHVHVFKGSDSSVSAKFWLRESGPELAHNKARLSQKELAFAYAVINANRFRLRSRWYDQFGDGGTEQPPRP